MQMKIGRWEGLYPRIQSAAKHVRCSFVCGSVLLKRVLTQARTGPPRRSESNESMEQQSLRRAWQTGLALAFSGHSNRGRCLNAVRVTKAAGRSRTRYE